MFVASSSHASCVFDRLHARPHELRMERDWAKLVTEILSRGGLTQDQFAQRVGVKQPTVSRWLRGSVPEDAHKVAILAEGSHLGILEEQGDEKNHPTVPIIGEVGPGAVIEFIQPSAGPLGVAKMPPRESNKYASIRVRGDGMLPIAEDGWTIYFDREKVIPTAASEGQLCVAFLADGTTVLRKLYPGTTLGKWNLLWQRATPLFDQTVEAISLVAFIAPK